jgi:antitoxin component YwqK of YwqJK toxin-antitoxin module
MGTFPLDPYLLYRIALVSPKTWRILIITVPHFARYVKKFNLLKCTKNKFMKSVESNNGIMGDVCKYNILPNNSKHGLYQHWYMGLLTEEYIFDTGVEYGPAKMSIPSNEGAPNYFGMYVSGKQEGIWYRYLNGGLYYSITFKNGIRHGTWTRFYRSGAIWFIGDYENNLQQGRWLQYDMDGKVIEEMEYDKGKIIQVLKPKTMPSIPCTNQH